MSSPLVRRVVGILFVALPMAILALVVLGCWMEPPVEYDIGNNPVRKPYALTLFIGIAGVMPYLLPLLLGGVWLTARPPSVPSVLLCLMGIVVFGYFDVMMLFSLSFSTSALLAVDFFKPPFMRVLFVLLPPTLLTSLLVLATTRRAWRLCAFLPLIALAGIVFQLT